MILKLKQPVQIGDSMITELSFREEICSGDMRGLNISDLDDWTTRMKIASRLCGQPDAVLDKTCLADGAAIQNVIAGFLKAGLGIGTES